MTTDQLFKELEKTRLNFELNYNCISREYEAVQTYKSFFHNDPTKALQKLYDYAKKKGLLK